MIFLVKTWQTLLKSVKILDSYYETITSTFRGPHITRFRCFKLKLHLFQFVVKLLYNKNPQHNEQMELELYRRHDCTHKKSNSLNFRTSREFLSFSANGFPLSLFIICITPITIFSPSNIGMLSKLLITNPSFSVICTRTIFQETTASYTNRVYVNTML